MKERIENFFESCASRWHYVTLCVEQLAGGACLGVGLYARLLQNDWDSLSGVSTDPAVLLIVAGGLAFLIGFCGCVGSLRENVILLKIVRRGLCTVSCACVCFDVLGLVCLAMLLMMMFPCLSCFITDNDCKEKSGSPRTFFTSWAGQMFVAICMLLLIWLARKIWLSPNFFTSWAGQMFVAICMLLLIWLASGIHLHAWELFDVQTVKTYLEFFVQTMHKLPPSFPT